MLMPNVTHTPEALFLAIEAFIKEQQTLISTNTVILTQLETMTKQLCDTMTMLPERKSRQYAPQMTALMEDLGKLSHRLIAQRDGLKQELATLNTQKKAQHAYTTTSTFPKPSTK